jgi:hypothetical protein
MASPTYKTDSLPSMEPKRFLDGYVFGAPMKDFGWFASLIIGVALGMAAFFAATFVGIFTLLFMRGAGKPVDFTISYRLIGLPVGVVVMLLALSYLGMLWVRRITRKA